MASLLALGAALSWGAGDFLGGIASRRLSIVTVLLARLVIAERLGLARRFGAGLALAGAALVAAG